MPPPPPRHVVVTDANVLINLMHVQRLTLLGALPALTFVVPEPVVAEITDPGQVRQLQAALQRQDLRQEAITALPELTAYAELRRIMGPGRGGLSRDGRSAGLDGRVR